METPFGIKRDLQTKKSSTIQWHLAIPALPNQCLMLEQQKQNHSN